MLQPEAGEEQLVYEQEPDSVLKGILRFAVIVLIIVAVVVAGTAASFLVIEGEFTLRAFGGRLFWGGIGTILCGGFFVFASWGSATTLGTPSVITAAGDSKVAHERIWDHIRTNDRRFTWVLRLLTAGALVIALSALIEVLTRQP